MKPTLFVVVFVGKRTIMLGVIRFIRCTGGAADSDAFGDSGASSAAWSCRRTLSGAVHTTQHFHLQTTSFVTRKDHQSSPSTTHQNSRKRPASGVLVYAVISGVHILAC